MNIFIKIIIIIIFSIIFNAEKLVAAEKIKIGLLVPLSGQHQTTGKLILQSVRLAINKINNPDIEILPKDTKADPMVTFKAAKELGQNGVKIIIGPVFNQNLVYLDELKDIIFLSLTNKTIKNPKNVISVGINAYSQLRAIINFQESNNLTETIFLLPKSDYEDEIRKAIPKTNIKIKKLHIYDNNPTKLTKQIENITKYQERKLDLKREIEKLKNSDVPNKNRKIQKLEKKDTLGKVNFDSVIIADFDESLKSITTSLLYTDVSPEEVYFITLNQWFDTSLLKEKSCQSLYFPSIDKENYDKFSKEYYSTFKEYPNQLSIISYDLIGLIYYLIYQNDFIIDKKLFIRKNKFKGKIGFFEIKENKISHILNIYKIEDNNFKKIF
tara:strand:- start:115 stop:1266 length:1152 start_codon:yes stop_codon:yes gene_type:complete